MSDPTLLRWLRVSAVLALVGLAFFVWSLVDQSPIPVIVAMSVGQGIGTLSFMLFLLVVALDLRHGGRRATKAASAAAASAASAAAAAAAESSSPAKKPEAGDAGEGGGADEA